MLKPLTHELLTGSATSKWFCGGNQTENIIYSILMNLVVWITVKKTCCIKLYILTDVPATAFSATAVVIMEEKWLHGGKFHAWLYTGVQTSNYTHDLLSVLLTLFVLKVIETIFRTNLPLQTKCIELWRISYSQTL